MKRSLHSGSPLNINITKKQLGKKEKRIRKGKQFRKED